MTVLDPEASALVAHLQTGATTVCRCWAVTTAGGVTLAFTDHDGPLEFDDLTFQPDAGMETSALVQTTGLSVDNAEGLGILSDAAITEQDILAGHYDGAEVETWLVNWADVTERALVFRGSIGEVRWSEGAFRSELRGLTEVLNQPQGRVFQEPCSAVLGDQRCGVDLSLPAFSAEVVITRVDGARIFGFASLGGYADGWFSRGRLDVLSGDAAGTVGVIKSDRSVEGERVLELWQDVLLPIGVGDLVRVQAGCNRHETTCRDKFNNFINYRGFPHIPGEDWMTSYPTRTQNNDGGSSNPSRRLAGNLR